MSRSVLAAIFLFSTTAIVALVARMPLVLVLMMSDVELQAERVHGTVWNGTIEQAWVAGYPLGTVTVSAHALPLFTGKVAADIQINGRLARGTGTVIVRNGDDVALKQARLIANIGALGLTDVFGAPMGGELWATVPSLHVKDRACKSGTIAVETDTLRVSARAYGGEGFELAGEGTCTDGQLVLPVAGQGGEGQINAVVRISSQAYTTELTITPTRAELGEALRRFGFERDGQSYTFIQRGELTL